MVYQKTNWTSGMVISSDGLNNLEEGVSNLSSINLLSGQITYATPSIAPYNDLDTLPLNKIITYSTSDIKSVAHVPNGLNRFIGGATVYTLSNDLNLAGAVQYFVGDDNSTYSRIAWGAPAVYSDWKSLSNRKMVSVSNGAPYDDLDTFPMNETVVIAETPSTISSFKHLPPIGSSVQGLTVISQSWSNHSIGGIQIAIDTDNIMYHRIAWSSDNNWGAWRSDKPEETYLYPAISLFEKVGVIGDSYASGELAFDGQYIDHYEISWLQQLARKNGFVGTNFSVGGSQTRVWQSQATGLPLLNSTEPLDFYIFALGINDVLSLGLDYLGVESDIDSGADTFYGNYGKIIQAVQSKAPNAKLVIATIAGYDQVKDQFNAAIVNLANHFGIPFIVLNDESFFASDFYKNNLVGGHPTAPVYSSMASAYERMIGKVMYTRYDYFSTYKK